MSTRPGGKRTGRGGKVFLGNRTNVFYTWVCDFTRMLVRFYEVTKDLNLVIYADLYCILFNPKHS